MSLSCFHASVSSHSSQHCAVLITPLTVVIKLLHLSVEVEIISSVIFLYYDRHFDLRDFHPLSLAYSPTPVVNKYILTNGMIVEL